MYSISLYVSFILRYVTLDSRENSFHITYLRYMMGKDCIEFKRHLAALTLSITLAVTLRREAPISWVSSHLAQRL